MMPNESNLNYCYVYLIRWVCTISPFTQEPSHSRARGVGGQPAAAARREPPSQGHGYVAEVRTPIGIHIEFQAPYWCELSFGGNINSSA
jgi:hypothetical protein